MANAPPPDRKPPDLSAGYKPEIDNFTSTEINAGLGQINPAADVNQSCANGGSSGNNGNGRGIGAQNDSALNSGIDPRLSNAFNCARPKWEAANPGLKIWAFSGRRPRNVAGSLHPSGRAMDVAIYDSNGNLFNNIYNGDEPAFRAYESFAEAMGSCGFGQDGFGRWGGNFKGGVTNDSMHFDVGQTSKTGNGNVFAGVPNPSVPTWSQPGSGIVYDGPKDAASANKSTTGKSGRGIGSPNDAALKDGVSTGQANCSNNNAGCQPIQAAAPAVAATIAQGAGLAPPLIDNITNASTAGPLAQAQSGLAAAAQAAGGGILAQAVGQAGLPAVLTNGLPGALGALTQNARLLVRGLGANILPSLTGVLPQALTRLGGGLLEAGNLLGSIQNVANTVLKQGVANFGGFPSILNSAISAAVSANGIGQVLNAAVGKVFSNAIGNISNLPGFDNLPAELLQNALRGVINPLQNENEGLEFFDLFKETIIAQKLDRVLPLVGNLPDVLKQAVSTSKADAFSSLFLDYQSMVTQGLGNLTDSLPRLGRDLQQLGTLGDLKDLFNIGTATQISRQLIERGLGNSTGFFRELQKANLNSNSIKDPSNEEKLKQVLDKITDPNAIQQVKQAFRISADLNLNKLGDLTEPEKILPNSYEFNRFEKLRDMAPTLAMCGNGNLGNLNTLSDLGRLMSSMETLEGFPEILEERTAARLDNMLTLMGELPYESEFNTNPTVADFIGTAAGYVHLETLPKIAELLESIGNHSAMANFTALMQLLQATLEGNYTNINTLEIVVPDSGGYTFGTYYTLDDATVDIVTAIETELQNLVTNLPVSEPELWLDIQKLEFYHIKSAEFLAHEKRMRRAYGVDIGDARPTENFYGDGSTISYEIKETAPTNFEIYVRTNTGTFKQKELLDYEYNSNTNSIIFSVAPGAGDLVEITYSTPVVNISSVNASVDAWNFASSLEGYALQTGYGNTADFINRLTTDDVDGQRIKAVMKQARNRYRFEMIVGIPCPGYNRILPNANEPIEEDFNFAEHTGIWSDDPARAAEIWLQLNTGMNNDMRWNDGIIRNSTRIAEDLERTTQNYMRQLLFLSGNNIAITPKLAGIYNSNKDRFASFTPVGLDLTLLDQFDSNGYVIGNYREVISEILRIEGIEDINFAAALSSETLRYLDKIDINMSTLVGVVQRTLLLNQAQLLGVAEQTVRDTFGMPGVGRYLLKNISQNY